MAEDTITSAKLRALANRLQAVTAPSEQVFLAVGQRLEEAIGMMRRVGEGMDRLTQDVGGGNVQGAVEQLRTSARSVVAQSGDLNKAESVIERLAGAGARGGRSIASLRQTINEVAILGINAKILTAQLTSNSTDFSAFIDEIARLAHAAGEGLEQLGLRHVNLAKLVAAARVSQHDFATTQGQALVDVGRRLDESLALLENHHHWAMDQVLETRRRSDEVGRLIGQAVRSLQINDITRQRVEHVIEVLEKGILLLDGRNDWSHGLDAAQRRELCGILCHLQAAQLRKAAQQFDHDVGSLVATLQTLARDADDMCRGRESREDGGRTVTGAALFRQLGHELDEAKGLLVRFGLARDGIRAAIGQVAEEARAMTAHVEAVRSIETDIRIMGLNATLKYSRLGAQGRALAVIAQELRHCAGRTRDQAKVVEDDLDGLIEGASALERTVGSGGPSDSEGVIVAMGQSLASLNDAERHYSQRMSQMQADGERSRALLADTIPVVDEHRRLGRDYLAFADTLEALSSTVIAGAAADGQMVQHARALLSGQYTMSAEREIHQLFFGEDPGASSPEAAGAEVEQDLADILF